MIVNVHLSTNKLFYVYKFPKKSVKCLRIDSQQVKECQDDESSALIAILKASRTFDREYFTTNGEYIIRLRKTGAKR